MSGAAVQLPQTGHLSTMHHLHLGNGDSDSEDQP